jgi:hypothetical protein
MAVTSTAMTIQICSAKPSCKPFSLSRTAVDLIRPSSAAVVPGLVCYSGTARTRKREVGERGIQGPGQSLFMDSRAGALARGRPE